MAFGAQVQSAVKTQVTGAVQSAISSKAGGFQPPSLSSAKQTVTQTISSIKSAAAQFSQKKRIGVPSPDELVTQAAAQAKSRIMETMTTRGDGGSFLSGLNVGSLSNLNVPLPSAAKSAIASQLSGLPSLESATQSVTSAVKTATSALPAAPGLPSLPSPTEAIGAVTAAKSAISGIPGGGFNAFAGNINIPSLPLPSNFSFPKVGGKVAQIESELSPSKISSFLS